MLKKQNQLTKDKEFDNVFKNGKSSYDKVIGVKVIANNLNDSRVGILVSTKISKKAVERNRLKRQIREVIKLDLEAIKPGYDFIVITLAPILGKTSQEITKSIHNHFKKLKLYK